LSGRKQLQSGRPAQGLLAKRKSGPESGWQARLGTETLEQLKRNQEKVERRAKLGTQRNTSTSTILGGDKNYKRSREPSHNMRTRDKPNLTAKIIDRTCSRSTGRQPRPQARDRAQHGMSMSSRMISRTRLTETRAVETGTNRKMAILIS
jgi:hypothetical protein